MSKQDKDLAETEGATELATDSALAGNGQEAQALPLTPAEPEQDSGQNEQSRQFNSWLDRALPRLMQYLGEDTTSAVTSPSPKAKH